jgi:hypothetical protein
MGRRNRRTEEQGTEEQKNRRREENNEQGTRNKGQGTGNREPKKENAKRETYHRHGDLPEKSWQKYT